MADIGDMEDLFRELLPEQTGAQGLSQYRRLPEPRLRDVGEPRVYSVSEAADLVRERVEVIKNVRIRGEISNWSYRKFLYFSLREKDAVISCCMFRDPGIPAPEIDRSGKMAEVRGSFSFYAKKGTLSFRVDSIVITDKEGLFMQALREGIRFLEDQGYTRNLLPLPAPSEITSVGIITAQGKQAARDAVGTIRRRNPLVNIVLYYSAMQGDAAPEQIMNAIYLANMRRYRDHCDVLLVVRGGGSVEDLACFNDLKLSVYATETRIPIVTGIGHTGNDTLLDHVASLKAATPTAAAELVTTDLREADAWLRAYRLRYSSVMNNSLAALKRNLDHLRSRLNSVSPAVFAAEKRQYLSHLSQRMTWAFSGQLSERCQELEALRIRLETARDNVRNYSQTLRSLELRLWKAAPDPRKYRGDLLELSRRMGNISRDRLRENGELLQDLERRLQTLSPARCLKERAQRLQDLRNRMQKAMNAALTARAQDLHERALAFAGVRPDLGESRHYLEKLRSRLETSAGDKIRLLGSSLAVLAGRLNARNPLTLLSQGYAIVSRESGGIVQSGNTKPGDLVHIRVLGARFTAEVTAAELLPGENAAGDSGDSVAEGN